MTKGNVLVIGAGGQMGRVAVAALAEDGWEVTAASRGGGRDAAWPAEVRAVPLDRADGAALAAVVGEGSDVVVDLVAYDAEHAEQLIGLATAGRIGSAVVVSTAAVYEDDRGRNFDTQAEPDGFPRYPVPVPESQRTVAPGGATYGTRKVRLEQRLAEAGDVLPTTVLRAGAVHGVHCRTPRELYFVKRMLDGRRRHALAFGGASRFHPTHTSNIGELIRLAARAPGSRVLNAADPQAPSVAEIAAAIGRVMGVETPAVPFDGPPAADGVGDTPWSVPHPVVLDMAAAERELGYRPLTTYADSLPATVDYLTARLAAHGDWREAFPAMAATYGDALFDYASEDAWWAART
ncbi:NAD-dependent epimerase/dehydratase family protein [Streptomyces fuscigenes]|uniref:NAD-dependent epimerase/dehydratase family protein n=1 Tax=Streptomyces fuscigenes TaxID=1528880 RepID=UPI001F2D356F|nr:NAD-dependent epimerase/dehydratase family protein [Streptomyces fuscigenes]MCF3961479.1 sugar nucleotide-binding protein [Streptomyces fuscigenes]